jgi:hypothetical protein
MDDQGKPKYEGEISPKTIPLVGIADSVNTPPNKPDTATELQKLEQQGKDLERQTTAFERSSLRWAKVSALMAFLTFVFISAQWYEMHTTGADTHDLAVAAGKQADAAKAQIEKMGESLAKTDKLVGATSDLAKEAKRSADAATNSLGVSRRAMQLDQRAWINISMPGKPMIQEQSPIMFSVRLLNTGKTIAKNVEANFAVSRLKKGDAPEFIYVPHSGHNFIRARTRTISPNFPMDFNVALMNTAKDAGEVILDKATHEAFRNGEFTLLIHGKVTYDDIFGVHHWMTFCADAGMSQFDSPTNAQAETILTITNRTKKRCHGGSSRCEAAT